jgi:hypothetical protein
MDDASDLNPRSGYISDTKMSVVRHKSRRVLRQERQEGRGPPFVKDGREILYSVEGYRRYLASRERQPVREPLPPGPRPGRPSAKRRRCAGALEAVSG